MRVLFATSEAHPLIKTGGLADVCGSLPPALKRLRNDVRMILPAYPQCLANAGKLKSVARFQVAGFDQDIELLEGQLPGTRVPLYLVDSPLHFQRAGDPYRASDGRDWQDNHLRYALFCRVIVQLALNRLDLDWAPEVLHCNDWQTGLAPAFLSQHSPRPASLFTVHNLAYQGLFAPHAADELILPPEFWRMDALEFHGQISFIKGGLAFADRINTVSPTYAREIQTTQFGHGLDGLLHARSAHLSGILNGVDYRQWDPVKDKHLPARYSTDDLSGKAQCKAALQATFGLTPDAEKPLLVHVGRMVAQKGVDLILGACEPLLAKKSIQLVILGSGEKALETQARGMAARHAEAMGLKIGYDEALAHQIEAGGDLFLMPSRFEPCGLNQIYSLRYGTPPLVRHTGGLADTVTDTSSETLAAGKATGFVFDAASDKALLNTIQGALKVYADTATWQQLMLTGMKQCFDWELSARTYHDLYKECTKA